METDFKKTAVKTNIGYLYFNGKKVVEILETNSGELLLYGKFPMSEEWAQDIKELAAEHEAMSKAE